MVSVRIASFCSIGPFHIHRKWRIADDRVNRICIRMECNFNDTENWVMSHNERRD